MPFTFLADQAPVLPVVRRWPRQLDGVAAVVGSLAPDVGYALEGTGVALSAHELPALVTFGVPVTLLLAWSVTRVLAPVVPDHLPRLGPFRLRDYRGLAVHRFTPLATACGTLLALVVHVGLDHLTHPWGRPARHIGPYDEPLVGDAWSPMDVVTITLHVGGAALCLWLLSRYGRDRWMSAQAARVQPFPTSRRSHATLWLATATGIAGGVAWSGSADPRGATVMMRVAGGASLGLFAGSLLAGRSRPAAPPPARPVGAAP